MHAHPAPLRQRPAVLGLVTVATLTLALAITAAPASAQRSTSAQAVAAASSHKVARTLFFHSPSKNIYCVIFRFQGKASGRCDIKEHTWTAPHKPRSCHLDYGNGAEVNPHGKGHFTCAGDTVIVRHHPALKYGHSIKLGAIKCTSRRTGMTCQSVKTGHGFTISREAVPFF